MSRLLSVDEFEIRAAEQALERALESADPTAFVDHYTEDAVFAAPGARAVHGREALLEMANAMTPLSSVSIKGLRTEASGDVAAVCGEASWVSGRTPNGGAAVDVRFVIVWRREADGRWRVAQELLNAAPEAAS